jgi:hypothetical protein
MNISRYIILFALCLISPALPANEWVQVSGKYVTVEYEPGLETIADSLLKIADNSIPGICEMAGVTLASYQEEKARIIVTDVLDVSNGFAIENTVVIYTISSDYLTSWTGNQTWYTQVLNHELVHLVMFRKLRRTVNLFGTIGYLTVPRWLWEGLAQYFSESWNAYRGDLYLKKEIFEGTLTVNDLDALEDGHLVYAVAHAFTRYLAEQYGDSAFIKLLSYKEDGFLYDFDAAFKHTFKQSIRDEFSRFIRHMILFYGSKYAGYPENHPGKKLPAIGFQTEQIIPCLDADSTYFISTRWNRNHLYLTALLARIKNGKFQVVDVLFNDHQTRLAVSPDQKYIAYGRSHLATHNNLQSYSFDWFVYNRITGEKKQIAKQVHARQAVFATARELILVEIKPDGSVFRRINVETGDTRDIFHCAMPVGQITTLSPEDFLFEAQRSNGNRDIFRLNQDQLSDISDDSLDDRRPVVVNDSLFYFNRYLADKPVVGIYNLSGRGYTILLNDQYDYWVENYNSRTRSLLLSSLQINNQRSYFKVVSDSLFRLSQSTVLETMTSTRSGWTRKAPFRNIMTGADTVQSPMNRKKPGSSYFPLLHGFTFGFPVYSQDYNFGIFATSTWLEVLQRQIFFSFFLIYPSHLDQSLALLNHMIKFMDLNLSTLYYHGPVIFTTGTDKWFRLNRDLVAVDISKNLYLNGNSRYSLTPSFALSWDHFKPNAPGESDQHPVQYTMGRLGARLDYYLPTRLFPLIAHEKISGYAYLYRSLGSEYVFQIQDYGLEAASNLFLENLGLKIRINYLKNTEDLPPFQILGIDRYYQFDFPRDFGYTRPVRGINRDISGRELWWNSGEIIFHLMERTPYRLIFLPLDHLALHAFFDFARLKNEHIQNIYGYGFEMTFGSTFLRLGAGSAWSRLPGEPVDQTWYLKMGLSLPMVAAQYRKAMGLPY